VEGEVVRAGDDHKRIELEILHRAHRGARALEPAHLALEPRISACSALVTPERAKADYGTFP